MSSVLRAVLLRCGTSACTIATMAAGVAQASWRVILRAVSLAAAGMLVASSLAFGQAAVEQYIPRPSPAGHHHRDRGSESGSTTGQSSSSSGSQAGAAVGA